MNQSPKQSANIEFKLCSPSLSESSFACSNSTVGTQNDSAFRFRTRERRVKTVNFDVGKNRPKLIGYHSTVPWTTAKQFYNLHIYIYECWNVGKDWFSSCWVIWRYRPILAELQHNFHFLTHFNLKTTQQIFTIFSHDVHQLVEL